MKLAFVNTLLSTCFLFHLGPLLFQHKLTNVDPADTLGDRFFDLATLKLIFMKNGKGRITWNPSRLPLMLPEVLSKPPRPQQIPKLASYQPKSRLHVLSYQPKPQPLVGAGNSGQLPAPATACPSLLFNRLGLAF